MTQESNNVNFQKNYDSHTSSKIQDSTVSGSAMPTKESIHDETDSQIRKRTFFEKWQHHRFLFFRATYTIFNTIWIVVMAVGGFIAWLIAMIAL